MNPRQRLTLTAGLIVFLVVGLVPPWTATRKYGSLLLGTNAAGHHLILDPPQARRDGQALVSYGVDLQRLGILWVIIVVATSGSLYLLGGSVRVRSTPPM